MHHGLMGLVSFLLGKKMKVIAGGSEWYALILYNLVWEDVARTVLQITVYSLIFISRGG